MSKPKEQKIDWKAEFDLFLSSQEIQPPIKVSEQILSGIRADLCPAGQLVFAKASLIHLVVGLVTLLFCPQFGFSFTPTEGLMSLLMTFGEGVCMFGCGAIFLGSSALVSSLVLRPEEVNVIRKTEWIHFGLLAAISMILFLYFSLPVLTAMGAIWLLGSILGAVVSLELGWKVRAAFRRRVVYGL